MSSIPVKKTETKILEDSRDDPTRGRPPGERGRHKGRSSTTVTLERNRSHQHTREAWAVEDARLHEQVGRIRETLETLEE